MNHLLNDPRGRHAWRVLCVVLTLAVLYLALTPRPPRELDTGWDKANHLLAFAALGATGWQGWIGRRGKPARMLALAAALIGLGVLIELLQSRVPGRSADAADVLADAVGIAIGMTIGIAISMATGALPAWLAARRGRPRCP